MKALWNVIDKVNQANTIAYFAQSAVEETTFDDQESVNRLCYMVYTLADMLKEIGPALEEIAKEETGHSKVIDAILEASHVRDMEKELEELRAKVNVIPQ